jgi:hypothetical protein
MRLIAKWETTRDRANSAVSDGSTSSPQISKEILGQRKKIFFSSRSKSRLVINGHRLPRRSQVEQKTRLKTGSTRCSRRSEKRKLSSQMSRLE